MRLDKLRIAHQFGRAAQTYDQFAAMQKNIAFTLVKGVMPAPNNTHSAFRVADLGCGTGYVCEALGQVMTQGVITAVDISASMLEVVKKKTIVPTTVAVNCVLGDIEQLPLESNQFDYVLSSSAMQWCSVDRAISEMLRIAKPGARLSVSTFTQGTLYDWRTLWMTAEQQQAHAFIDNNQLQTAIQTLGGNAILITTEVVEQRFTDFQAAINSVRQLGAGNAVKSSASGLAGRKKVMQARAAFERLVADQGYMSLTYQVAYAHFNKGQ